MVPAETAKLPKGLICPLVTPLETGDVVDVTALAQLIDHVDPGVDALLVCDVFWGESLQLSFETRLEMTRAVLEITRGRWPVLITITSHTRKSTRDLMAHTENFIERSDYPGRVYWVDYPIYYHSNRSLPQWYESMTQDTSIEFVLGNHAGLIEQRKRQIKHKNIRTSVLKKISQIERIRGLVFSGTLKRSINYQKAVRISKGFRFFDGDEAVFLRQPSTDGVVAGGANILPEAWRAVTRSSLNRYDVQQQYPDHTSQILSTAVMLEEFRELYSQNKAGIVKRMLHVAGVLPNAHSASATEPTSAAQNRLVEAICRKYDLV